MPLTLLKKNTYVYATEPFREAIVDESGKITPGREIQAKAVLQLLDPYPNTSNQNRDVVRAKVIRSPSILAGVSESSSIPKDTVVLLYMREHLRLLKTSPDFQKEVEAYIAEQAKPKLTIATDMTQAMNAFLTDGRVS